MNSTQTKLSTTIVDQRHATSSILFGGESNAYYSDERSRQIVTRVERNVHGEYVAHLGTGRTIDFAGTECELFGVQTVRSSPLFTVVDDAREWACDAAHWALDNLVSGYSAPGFPLAAQSHTYCTSCGHFDTLTTALMSYSDETTCTTSGCDFSHSRSIGD